MRIEYVVSNEIADLLYKLLNPYGACAVSVDDGVFICYIGKIMSVKEIMPLLRRIRAIKKAVGINIIIEKF